MLYIGIDLGGTGIKAGVVDEQGNILIKDSCPTGAERGYEAVIHDMATLALDIVKKGGYSMADVKAIGVGLPGVMDQRTGRVPFCTNLSWHDVPLVEEMAKYTDVPVFADNDATVAGLAESVAGVSAGCKNSVFVTLGTGVGGGIVIGGKPWPGAHGRGGEIGHMTLVPDGAPCTCGNNGCVERYCSATAIIRMAKQECYSFPNTAILKKAGGDINRVNAKLVIDAAKEGDASALRVFNSFVKYLAMTINCESPDHYVYVTLRQAADSMLAHNCYNAYTLDGGQTGSILIGGKLINPVQFGYERQMSDIFYFATAIPDK